MAMVSAVDAAADVSPSGVEESKSESESESECESESESESDVHPSRLDEIHATMTASINEAIFRETAATGKEKGKSATTWVKVSWQMSERGHLIYV